MEIQAIVAQLIAGEKAIVFAILRGGGTLGLVATKAEVEEANLDVT